jgi:hypothetical protein
MMFDSETQSNDIYSETHWQAMIFYSLISLAQLTPFEPSLATMDLPPAWSQSCVCGRAFSLPQAYAFHQRSCQRTKKRLLGALGKVKDILQARKRRKLESVLSVQNTGVEAGPPSQLVDLAHPNDLYISAVPPEVRLPFNRVHHLLTYSLFQNAAPNLAAEAGAFSHLADIARPNDIPIPAVHLEVRFPFKRVHH